MTQQSDFLTVNEKELSDNQCSNPDTTAPRREIIAIVKVIGSIMYIL